MSSTIARRQTPEERELEKKKAELAALETELAQRELELATLQGELHAFERRYLRIVGVRYAELDEIEAQIAELLSRQKPQDDKAQRNAAEARAKAEESAQAAGTAKDQKLPADFKPSEGLKKLYREIAKRVHPDLTTDEKERARRNQIMAEANRAYEAGDEAKLRTILEEWESSPDTVKGEGVGAELVRAIRKVHQVQNRLAEIETKITQLEQCELSQLKTKAEEVSKEGRDLLREMATRLDSEIADAKKHLGPITRNTLRI
jgi:peptidoglycan hydrolase CwlO-like protein